MKDLLRSACQKILGYHTYLFVFALFGIKRIKWGLGHEEEFSYFSKMIPDDDSVILDIGANIGVMSAHMAMTHRHAKVFAFEPIPDNQRTIEKVCNWHRLTNVTLFKTALGDEAGAIKMVVPVVGNAQMQGLSHVVEKDADADGQTFTVPVQRLDAIPELVAANRISAIKIDVENFEYYVLKGAHALLVQHKPIIYCELWDNERRTLCLAYMKELGYRIMTYQEQTLVPFTGQTVMNFFFIPEQV
jgi:FkbM family methyltransferase